MRVLLDVNVVLDVLADRHPFAPEAEAVLRLAENGVIEGVVAAHTVTTLHFLLSRHLDRARANRILGDLIKILSIGPVDGRCIRQALAMSWPDFEDAVQAACAEAAGSDYLVTRDRRSFRASTVPVLSPAEVIALTSG